MDSGSDFDWIAFALGFGLALLIVFIARMRRSRRTSTDLTAPPRRSPPVSDLSAELRTKILLLKAEGRAIDAIKLARERTGVGLAEAKQLVDQVR
jgi:large subunit ribosomal protein L7/L12